ncbi:MAG TPA: Mrp/NBP35 family ATP-binding protein [Pseudobdellovibrionaceae bacterium]|nr:Mrp/NBP35 family ATP-binding protein [Pseudobdellovibrionaceae bacterium]
MNSNPFQQQKPISGVKKIIAVSSGKGGVGKSTTAVNLAMALSKLIGPDKKVGILDADIHGPSLPRMFGALHQKPEIKGDKIQPIERYGLKIMSIGFLVEEDSAVIWRGPMLFKALDQFFNDLEWGDLEYLVLDLPPGTGDIPLSIAQKVPVFGSVTVTTPQNISLGDVKKSLDMWTRVNVPVLGVIENMSYLMTPSGESVQLFPKGDLNGYLDSKNIKKLGEIPFDPLLGLSCEVGIPLVESHPDSPASKAFFSIAQTLINL